MATYSERIEGAKENVRINAFFLRGELLRFDQQMADRDPLQDDEDDWLLAIAEQLRLTRQALNQAIEMAKERS